MKTSNRFLHMVFSQFQCACWYNMSRITCHVLHASGIRFIWGIVLCIVFQVFYHKVDSSTIFLNWLTDELTNWLSDWLAKLPREAKRTHRRIIASSSFFSSVFSKVVLIYTVWALAVRRDTQVIHSNGLQEVRRSRWVSCKTKNCKIALSSTSRIVKLHCQSLIWIYLAGAFASLIYTVWALAVRRNTQVTRGHLRSHVGSDSSWSFSQHNFPEDIQLCIVWSEGRCWISLEIWPSHFQTTWHWQIVTGIIVTFSANSNQAMLTDGSGRLSAALTRTWKAILRVTR